MNSSRIGPLLLALLIGAAGCEPASEEDTGSNPADGGGVLSLAISPAEPGTEDDLEALVETSEDTRSVSFAWYVDNVEVLDLDRFLVPAERTARGEAWRVVVTPDLEGPREQPLSAKVLVGNAPPVVDTLAIDGVPTVETDITATATTSDADDDPVSLSWHWSIDGVAQEGWFGTGLPTGVAIRDQVVEVEVTPWDGEDEGEPVTASVTMGNAPPSLAAATLGATTVGPRDSLSVRVEGWSDPDGDLPQFHFSWYVDEALAPEASSSLDLGDHPGASAAFCLVTPFDGADEGQPVSTEIVIVVQEEE